MKLLILTRYDRLGASSRLRMLQYVEHLEKAGIRCTVSPLLGDSYLERLYDDGTRSPLSLTSAYLKRIARLVGARSFDKLWVEKELFPQLPAVVERLLPSLGLPYVVDYDDAVFHNYDMSKSRIVRALLGRKIDVVMAHAESVIAGNTYIAERAAAAGARDVRILPTVVDHRRYLDRVPARPRPVTIGWIGSPTTQPFLLAIADVLIDVCRRRDARLLLVGAQPGIARYFQEIDLEIRSWSEETERADIADMDVGIMPLEDKAWERGKCGYKLIQYMASGVAVCASPVGVNIDIVANSGAGLLAANREEWREALDRLIRDAEARREMESLGRRAVERSYSVESQVGALIDILAKRGRSRPGAQGLPASA